MPTAGNDDIGDLGDGIAGIRGVDWEAPTGAEAIEHGRTSWKWEKDDEDLAVLKRLLSYRCALARNARGAAAAQDKLPVLVQQPRRRTDTPPTRAKA